MNILHHSVISRQVKSGMTGLLCVLILFTLLFTPGSVTQAQSTDIGYRDFTYPSKTGGDSQVTGEKPESKLWWNDGAWYGCLWSRAANAYHIYRLDTATQAWTDTGVTVDTRLASKADTLRDGSKLYVASHVFAANNGQPTSSSQRGRLYRYSYNTSSKTYSLDSGYPVEITGGKSETLVIDKDSSGQLWVTYVESNTVMVNHSLNGDDRLWGTPFALPAGGKEKVNSDDISSIITYNQQVGIMWSNQSSSPYTMYFAVHPIGSPDSNWTRVRAYGVSGDDHINLKTLQSDSAGNVFAVIKTAKSSALIVVLVCKNNLNRCKTESDWTPYTVYNSSTYNPTRPMMLIDETNRQIYVFTRNEDNDGSLNGGIYYKRADLDNISFPTGKGTAFIRTAQDVKANNATSTKQNVNSTTGLLVLASDNVTKYYLHNYLSLGGTQPQPPSISSFSPTSGPVGTEVTLDGSNFSQVSAVLFDNSPAQSFVIDSATRIRAVVPAGATSGPIQVNSQAGNATSSSSFTVTTVTTNFSLSVAVTGSGTVALSPTGGSYPAGTIVNLTAQPETGWQFSGWQGDLSGSSNPASLTMDANKSVTAVFSQQTGGGTVTYKETAIGGAVSGTTVTTAGVLTGVESSFYLAAISSRSSLTVSSVSGLGLTWTRVDQQCAGRNQTMMDVWMAQGTPSANGTVSAQFGTTFQSAVIAVSRYTGVSTSQPLGNVVSGNSLGAEGACAGGVDSASYTFPLATSSQGAMVYVAAAMRNRSHTPGSGYTERAEIMAGSSGDISSVAVQDKSVSSPATVDMNGSFSGTVDWAIVGLEIRPAN